MTLSGASGAGPEPLSGRQLGEWIVGEVIGSGGFADVYRARQPRLERDAVIKVLRLEGGAHEVRIRRFEAEARLASQLDHPFAAHVYSYGSEPDGLMWIAMELVRGETLRDYIKRIGHIPLAQFVPLFERLCEVVHSAHQVGLLHRDIKPANVMVIQRAGRLLPKLLDFGIAEALGAGEEEREIADEFAPVAAGETSPPGDAGASAEAPETLVAANVEDGQTLDGIGAPRSLAHDDTIAASVTTSLPGGASATEILKDEAGAIAAASRTELGGPRLVGTPAYMAPERWVARARVDHRSDIYALGILAHHSLTGALPFRGESWREYWEAHTYHEPEPLGREFPAAVTAAVNRAVAKDPQDRFASALEFGQAMRVAADPRATPSLTREQAGPWLLGAPAHIGASLVAFEAAALDDRGGCLEVLVGALAQWIGVVAAAASSSTPGLRTEKLRVLCERRLSPREWLEFGQEVCSEFSAHPGRFAVPELVMWFSDRSNGVDTLLGLLALRDSENVELARISLLGKVLGGLSFFCEYPVVTEPSERSHEPALSNRSVVWLADGDRNPHLELTPLVASRSPSPGASPVLFVVDGPGREGAVMTSQPHGFEIESEEVWPWLGARFAIAPDLGSEEALSRPPYRGLASFTRNDSALFFGRNRDLQNLFNRVIAHPFVALTGPSGSGKSSLVQAGLLGQLGDDWTSVTVRPGSDPMRALENGLIGIGDEGDEEDPVARACKWARDGGRRLVIVVDQAEELLTLANRERADAFAAAVVAISESAPTKNRIVLTIRDDFVGRVGEIVAWRDRLATSLLLVSAPTRQELSNMIVGPAHRVGYSFDDESVVDEMVDEVFGQPGALPLLSFAASRLWNERARDDKLLTRRSFDKMGGVAGALAVYAEETLTTLPTRQQQSVRNVFRRLVSGSGTRAWVSRTELRDVCDASVIEHLVAARILVVADGDDGSEQVSIIHEALLTRWPRLARWRDEDAAGLRFRDELRSAVSAWNKHGRDPSYLWRGSALRTLGDWEEAWAVGLSENERAFASASRRFSTRGRRRRRLIAACALALLALAVVVLVVLNRRVASSQQRVEVAYTDMLAGRGYSELVSNRRQRALAYLFAAYERGRDTVGMRVALALAQRGLEAQRVSLQPHSGPTQLSYANLPGRRDEFLSNNRNESAKLWRWDGESLAKLSEFEHDASYTAELSGDGKYVATISLGSMKLWNRDGTLRKEVTLSRFVHHLRFVPSRQLIVSMWRDTIAYWDLDGNQLGLFEPLSFTGHVKGLVLTDDGELVASVLTDGQLEAFDVDSKEKLLDLDLEGRPTALAFSPDKKRLYVGMLSGAIVSVELATKKVLRKELGQRPTYFRFHQDGKYILTESRGEPPVAINALTLESVITLDAPDVSISDTNILSSPTSATVVAANGSVVKILDGNNLGHLYSVDIGGVVSSLHFSEDGLTLFVGTTEGGLAAWDVGGRDAKLILRAGGKATWAVAQSPDGKTVARLRHETLEFLDSEGTLVRSVSQRGTVKPIATARVSFSPDGKRVLFPDEHRISEVEVETGLPRAIYSQGSKSNAAAYGDKLVALTAQPNRSTDTFVRFYDRQTERFAGQHASGMLAYDLEFTPKDTHLFYGTSRGVTLLNVVEKRVVWTARASGVLDVDVTADGRLAVASSLGPVVTIWHTTTGEVYRTLRPPRPITDAVGFSPDGRLLATASRDFSIYLWDVEAGEAVGTLRGHGATIKSVEFASDSSLISLDSGSHTYLWELGFEERPPAELGEVIREKLPFRLEGTELVSRSLVRDETPNQKLVTPASE